MLMFAYVIQFQVDGMKSLAVFSVNSGTKYLENVERKCQLIQRRTFLEKYFFTDWTYVPAFWVNVKKTKNISKYSTITQ